MKIMSKSIREKSWLERLADYILGPAPQPIFVVGAAAFNGGKPAAGSKESKR